MPARPHRLGAVLAALVASGPPASAQEPLFLRIRPQDSTPRDGGAGPSAAEVAAARAAREAVWERSAARARIAIASVCTGCLGPPPAVPTPARTLTAAGASANGPASAPAADTALVPASDPIPPTRGDP